MFAQSLKKSLSWNWKKKVEKKLKLKKKVLKVRVKIEKKKVEKKAGATLLVYPNFNLYNSCTNIPQNCTDWTGLDLTKLDSTWLDLILIQAKVRELSKPNATQLNSTQL